MDKNTHEYCERLRKHIAATERDPEVAKISLNAIDIYQKVMRTNTLTADQLDQITEAMICKRLGPYYIGTDLLLRMFPRFPEVEAKLRTLFLSPRGYERWAVVTMLDAITIPDELAIELLKSAINDRSAKVRTFAVERIFSKGLFSLAPLLKARLEIEKNRNVIRAIEFVLPHIESFKAPGLEGEAISNKSIP